VRQSRWGCGISNGTEAFATGYPGDLVGDDRSVWAGWEQVAGPRLEAYCGQVARMRDAQRRIAVEGLVVADGKGQPMPHPALVIERTAQDEIRKWGDTFRVGRPAQVAAGSQSIDQILAGMG
jgi:hypothetical protein